MMESLTHKSLKRKFFKGSIFTVLVALVTVFACEVEKPVPTYTLTTSVTPSEGGKINVSPQESNYVEGSQVTLTPEPNENWVFKQWEGDATGSTNPFQLTMTANKNIVGVFVKRDYPLNIKIEGEGTVGEKIVPNPSGREYPHGTRVELNPIPKDGWVFESWGGDLTGNETPKIITVDKEKNVTVKFKRRDYPLNITITGEGTVEEEIISNLGGRSYPFQTIVELKPVPKLGWEFDGWSGDLTGNEVPKRITVDKQKNVTAKFKEKKFFYSKKSILINSSNFSPANVENTMRIVSSAFIYKDSNGDIFSFHAGQSLLNGGNSITTIPPVSSQILRKLNGEWIHFKEDEKAQFWAARNYKVLGDNIVIGDANEIGTPQGGGWKGNILFGKILPGGNIDWKTVNKPEEMGYFHDVSLGDLNNDGLLDIGGTPGNIGIRDEARSNIFIQQSGTQFLRQDELLSEKNHIWFDERPWERFLPFAIQFENLFGDSRPEIISAEYGGGFLPNRGFEHQLRIFAYDDLTKRYELKFRANQPSAYSWWIGATSIKVLDANKDGIKDIAIAREAPSGPGGHGFDIWLGKPNGTFTFAFSKQFTNEELSFREFVVMDANNDGKDDIILIPFIYGSLFRLNGPCGPGSCQGIKLNHLIWLSKGDGTFENYSKSALVFPEINVNFLLPYKEGNKLYFYGTNYSGSGPTFNYQHDVYDIRINIDN